MSLIYTRLKIPDDIISEEDFGNMSQENKRFYLEKTILKLLKINRDKEFGLTIQNILSVLNFSNRKTISNYLERLVASREVFCLTGKPKRFFINGRISHEILGGTIELSEEQFYEIKLISNNLSEMLSPLIFIQEFRRDEFNEIENKGGIMIKGEYFEKFIDSLVIAVPNILEVINNFRNKIQEVID